MKNIKTLTIQFENELPPKLVPAFRGAIIEKVKREHILFHQHISDDEVLYKYPLIQYKSLYKNAGIVCLGDGTNEMYRLFSQKNLKIKLHESTIELNLKKVELDNFNLEVSKNKKNQYEIVNWLGLNKINNTNFNKLNNIDDKIILLEKILKANILAFAKGVDWFIEDKIYVSINEVKDHRIIRYKGQPLNCFDLIIETNINLPLYIGLGKSVSHGYGMIKSKK